MGFDPVNTCRQLVAGAGVGEKYREACEEGGGAAVEQLVNRSPKCRMLAADGTDEEVGQCLMKDDPAKIRRALDTVIRGAKKAQADLTKRVNALARTQGFRKDDSLEESRRYPYYQGSTIHRYHQHYKGLPVIAAEYIVEEKAGKVLSADGNLIIGLALSTVPVLSEAAALQAAEEAIADKLKKSGPPAFPWKVDPAEPAPRGSLAIASREFGMTAETARLVWSFDIVTSASAHEVHIDAMAGDVVNVMDLIIR